MPELIAKGIHNHPHFKLGSITGSGKKDKRTLLLSDYVNAAEQAPVSYDFDKRRKAFPVHMWGNDQYGDCEIAGRANYLLRLQRQQTRTTPALTDDDAISLYKTITGCASPGDNNDSGMETLTNLSSWRAGWSLTKKWENNKQETRDYHISAYGLVDHTNAKLLRLCTYLFQGTLFGINLPLTAQAQTENNHPWDVVATAGSQAEPGSWGGHCVYAKAYDANGVKVLTWGREVYMTNAFINEYVEEVYSVVDSFDSWFHFKRTFDVDALIAQMKNAGINVKT